MGRGRLTERELGKALVNGDFTSFDPHTVKMMIRMFDADKDGSINFEEFWYFPLLCGWVVPTGRADMSAAASGVSSLPGAPSSIALTRIEAGTYLSMSTRRHWLPLATGFLPPSLNYYIRLTIKAARIA